MEQIFIACNKRSPLRGLGGFIQLYDDDYSRSSLTNVNLVLVVRQFEIVEGMHRNHGSGLIGDV